MDLLRLLVDVPEIVLLVARALCCSLISSFQMQGAISLMA